MMMAPEDVQKQHRFYGKVTLLVVAGFLIPLIGLVAELLFCNDLFSRFGAVLILVELLVGALRLKGRTDDQLFEWLRMELMATLAPAGATEDVLNKFAPEMSRRDFADRLRFIYEKHSKQQSMLNATQIGFLALGTFIWAFGDLIVNFQKCVGC